MISRFVLIDDDPINNVLCKMLIRLTIRDSQIISFKCPREAFEFIKFRYTKNNVEPDSIVFLDLNMPEITGWEFLELFEELDEKVKNKIKIYILSSSLDPKEKKRAVDNENVIDYITKPITKEIILRITSGKVSNNSHAIST